MQIALMQSHICARNIACMVGRIISMGLVLGPVTRFMTKGYYAMLESHVAWCYMLIETAEGPIEHNFFGHSPSMGTMGNQFGV